MSTNLRLAVSRLVTALALLAGVCRPAAAWVSGGNPQWPQGNIVMQIQVDTLAPGQPLSDGANTWGEVVTGALSDWNSYLSVSRFTWVLNSTASANTGPNTANGYNNVRWGDTIYGESWGAAGGDVAGIALLWFTNDKMSEGDVLFNSSTGVQWDSYRGNLRYASNGQSINDLKRIALHEFGHVLGLDHPDQHGQAVAAIMNSVESNTDDLTSDDAAGGRHFYAAVLPPVVTQQPIASQTVALGGSTSAFSVYVQGTPPFSYQWYHNNVALTGSSVYTSWAFSLSGVTSNDAGTYDVVVSNSAGSVTSSGSVLNLSGSAPTITTQPASQTVSAGSNVTFSVVATGATPLSYQWQKDGTAISGATAASYTRSNVQAADAGNYAVLVTNSAGSTTSSSAKLTVNGAAPTITTQPASQSVSVGAAAALTVAATGTTPMSYQWSKDGVAIAGATATTYSIASVTSASAGNYTVVVTNAYGSATSNSATLTAVTGPTAWLTNLSVRANMAAGQTMIVGFTTGGGTESVLVRGIGPGLVKTFPQFFTAAAVMADPRLSYYPNGTSTSTYTNDNWDSSLAGTFTAVGAFPLDTGSLDAAFVQPIQGPNNSVWVQGTGAGIVLVEAYGVGTSVSPRLTNISARNHVGTGADILIAGFAIGGTGTKKLLIRGIGPGLIPLGVTTGTLNDPLLEVYDSSGSNVPLATNDNWDSALASTFNLVGAFGLTVGSPDAAMVVTLPAGATYSAELKGVNGATGEGLVEIYELP